MPVNLFPANRSSRAPLRMLGPDGEPLSRKYYSEKTERDLDADEMVRGYEIEKGKYVVDHRRRAGTTGAGENARHRL